MRKRLTALTLHLALMLLGLSIMSCTDSTDHKESPIIQPPLTSAALQGSWTFDIDGIDDKNLGTIQFDFAGDQLSLQATAINIDSKEYINDTYPETTWRIEENYLETPNKYGHRDALLLDEGDSIVAFPVKKVKKDTIELYCSYDNGNCVIETPLRIVRQEASGNMAQLFDSTDVDIDEIVADMNSSFGAGSLGASMEDKYNCWMSKVDGKTLVCDMAIPGVHDCTTDKVNVLLQFLAKTQAYNVEEQWDKGYRVFDLRVRNYLNHAEMVHGPVPCFYSFHDIFTKLLKRVLRDKSEFGFVFINTEGQDAPGWVDDVFGDFGATVVTRLVSAGMVDVHTNALDEVRTRQFVYNDIKDILKEYNAEDKICYYTPDLTLDEARGKLIVINRVPSDFYRGQWDFVGQSLIKDEHLTFIADDPNKCPTQKNIFTESNLYFAFKDEYKDNDEYDAAHLDEYKRYSNMGYYQRLTGKTRRLLGNEAVSSYPETLGFGLIKTPLPNYVDAAHNLYKDYAAVNRDQRSCGIFKQDFAGKQTFGRIGLDLTIGQFVTFFCLTKSLWKSVLLMEAFTAAKNAVMQTDVYGDLLGSSVIEMNFVKVPLEEASINNTYIEGAKGYTERLYIEDFYPHDANTDLDVTKWESDNESVATIAQDGTLTIHNYGNAVITATLKSGFKTHAYVCCARRKIQPINLGLSVQWADRDLGAAQPENAGAPFGWGDHKPLGHYRYDKNTWAGENEYIKYNDSDKRRTLLLEDDPAHIILGGKWRMPTRAEVQELINNSTKRREIRNGKPVLALDCNGNTIYLPETPYIDENGPNWARSTGGFFWTSNIAEQENTHAANWLQAYCIRIDMGDELFIGNMGISRYYGIPIRPVQEW